MQLRVRQPLGRGAPTSANIDERIHLSPAHISTFGWGLWSGGNKPVPLERGASDSLDALGQSRSMLTQRWSWLIRKTEASDAELLKWAQSYSQPPSLEVKGARIGFPSYSAERRALRVVTEASDIEIKIKPAGYAMNPVIEIEDAPGELVGVTLDGKPLAMSDFAWDGATLWVRASIDAKGVSMGLRFR